MVGWSPSLGWSASNYNLFYCLWIWPSKFPTGKIFGSQILLSDILTKLNTFDIGLVFNFFLKNQYCGRIGYFLKERVHPGVDSRMQVLMLAPKWLKTGPFLNCSKSLNIFFVSRNDPRKGCQHKLNLFVCALYVKFKC